MLMFFRQPSGEPETFFTLAQLLFANPANMPDVVMFLDRCVSGWIVIAFIQAQMLWFLLGRLGSIHHNRFNRFLQQFRIDDIGTCQHYRKRTTVAVGQNALFCAIFGAIGGIWPYFIASQTRLTHRTISSLPLPIHQPEFFALFHQQRPQLRKQTNFHPMLKGAMNGRVVAIDPWNVVPLTSRADPKNDGIHHVAWISTRSARLLRWIHFQNE